VCTFLNRREDAACQVCSQGRRSLAQTQAQQVHGGHYVSGRVVQVQPALDLGLGSLI
jgi:hypothetical protein